MTARWCSLQRVSTFLLKAMSSSRFLFIPFRYNSGMGGGTGTGATPVIANLCKERGILTVAIVTMPFLFEGTRRMEIAYNGIQQLQKTVRILIVFPNRK